MANSNQDNARENLKEISDYRKKRHYFGVEDDSVSGKAARESYGKAVDRIQNSNPEGEAEFVMSNKTGFIPYNREAATEAQAKQREVMNERRRETKDTVPEERLKKGGAIKKMAKGGKVSSVSKRADGCAQRGKTRGRMC
jgi:hypothetical protein